MSRLFLTLIFAGAMSLLLNACTLSLQPLHKNDPNRGHGEVQSVTCAPYFAPSFATEPDLPEFTNRELKNDTLFKRKLAKYTERLQEYIETEHEQQRTAWRAYAKECHIL